MNANVKQWVAALRSKEYKQTRGHLRDGDQNGYCCLGVACDISDLGKWGVSDDRYGDGVYTVGRYSDWANLPTPVRDYFGLKDNLLELQRMNDGGSSFEEIADFIESEPEGLFA